MLGKLITVMLYCLILVSALANSALPTISPVIFDGSNRPEQLGAYMEYLIDPGGTLDFETIRALPSQSKHGNEGSEPTWRVVQGDGISGGYTDDVYWVRFSVKNTTDTPISWILETKYSPMDFIELYKPESSMARAEAMLNYVKQVAGDHYPFKQRDILYRNPAFSLVILAHTSHTYYLRFETQSSMMIHLHKWPGNTFVAAVDLEKMALGLFFGILLITAFYNFVSAIFLRDISYVWVGIALIGSAAYSGSISGLSFQYFWPNGLWLQQVAIPFLINLSFLFIILYSQHFLDLKNTSSNWLKVLNTLIIIGGIFTLLSPIVRYSIIIRISMAFALTASFLCFLAGVFIYLKGHKSARYYCLGWVVLLFGLVTFALKTSGVVPTNLFTIWCYEFCLIALAILLTIAQSDRVLQMRRQHEQLQRQSMDAIEVAEKKYRSLFENAIEGIFQMNSQGLLLSVNKAFSHIVGEKDEQKLLGYKSTPYSLGFLGDVEAKKLAAILGKKDLIADYKATFVDHGNDTHWISISIHKVKNEASNEFNFEGSIADITETKKREQAEKQRRMAEASTEAKSLFLANMSHEIRTPMNAIIGFTELAMSTDEDHKRTSFLKKIKMASTNLLGIINDILDFSKMEAGKLKIEYVPFSVSELMENLRNIVASNVEAKGLRFNIDVDPDIPDLLIGDALRIHQVLVNLTNNATKFTKEGEVTVELDLRLLNKKNGTIKLVGRVRDTGIGISAEKLNTLSSSFTQADDSTTRMFGGTGLGLSISKQLVEMMGGEINVTSVEGHGSCFEFSLACRIESRKSSASAPGVLSNLIVLLVDDDQESWGWYSTIMAALSLRLHCVASSHEALEAIHRQQQTGQTYDLLLIDWLMPDVDGLECRQLIADDQGIIQPRTVLISTYCEPDLTQKALDAGFDACLEKPIQQSVLAQVIARLFEQRASCDSTASGSRMASKELKDSYKFSGLKVLLVEDIAMNQELVNEILASKGVLMTFANNGLEGLDRARAEHFDVILMDMQMPVMDGCQATRAIREFDQHIPIIAMTANAMAEDKVKCLEAGMNAYVSKPINAQELFAALLKWAPGIQRITGC